MKRNAISRGSLILGGVMSCAALWALLPHHAMVAKAQAAQPPSNPTNQQIAVVEAEVARLKSMAGDQSHAMADVGYHFANLWFASEMKHWLLAKFYFDETRSHLNWAVRIIPIRKDPAGNDVNLKAILDALDTSVLARVGKAIDAKNSDEFVVAYKQTLEGCYSCHKASGKPFLRPQIPKTPPQPIINFDPDAKWPE